MPTIDHEIKVHAAPDRILQAVSAAEDLEAWHGGRVAVSGGMLRIDFGDGAPRFSWALDASAPGVVVWRCVEGPGDSVGTEAVFKVSPTNGGRTLVEFAHRGWPHTGGNFRKCNTTWAILLHHLRRFLETGTPSPALARPP
jgi:hypothetical protein